MTAAELLERISSREVAEWRAFYRLEAEDREAERNGHKDPLTREAPAGPGLRLAAEMG